MNQSQIFSVNAPKVVHETLEGEVVIVNLDKGDYYSLVKAGADIWNNLAKGLSQGEILADIIERYDSSPENITEAVNNFIEQLQREELIILAQANESNQSNIANSKSPENSNKEKLPFAAPTLEKYTDMEELLALDPIHEVDEQIGWPSAKVEV